MPFSCTVSKVIARDPVMGFGRSMRVTMTVTSVTDFADKGLFLFQEVDLVRNFQTVVTPATLSTNLLGAANAATGFLRLDGFSVTVADEAEALDLIATVGSSLAALCKAQATLRDNGVATSSVISE